ncbi:LysR family transcriptional regulator [Luteibacter jiangsuensis]|uniref:LysR family transcriptional regulator n=1 Tax=Luteibacter jiangsuensis TaxID=637577 RepID=A0ABX0Q156_9GAMM|nr:LysR substrate-binding domain-containing protein [Luteibacter jiangsuensis]NID04255.1 LysR family transcriptional regulator [Luteibacter jiangsuensis]
MALPSLDLDVLRTLVAAQRLGGFARAADFVGRSQSAVSLQIRRIEAQLGVPLFRKQGRGLVPTEAGEVLLAYGTRLLSLNEEAVAAVRGCAIEGSVRFGLPGDFADGWLPWALGQFKRAHPGVRIEVAVDRNGRLLERLDEQAFDLVLALGAETRADARVLAQLQDVWIGASDGSWTWAEDEPVPLAVLEAPCMFRQSAIAALDRAGLRWRIAFVSPSLHGLWAAVEAGLGVTLRTAAGLPRGLGVLGVESGLPALPDAPRRLCLHDGGHPPAPAVARLAAIIAETVPQTFPGT